MTPPSAVPASDHRLRRRVLAALPAAALCALLAPSPAAAQSPMIQGWLAANSACKSGSGDEARTQKACARRDDLSAKLKRRGCEYQEDGDWWRCPH